jgi:hypothetical protein
VRLFFRQWWHPYKYLGMLRAFFFHKRQGRLVQNSVSRHACLLARLCDFLLDPGRVTFGRVQHEQLLCILQCACLLQQPSHIDHEVAHDCSGDGALRERV